MLRPRDERGREPEALTLDDPELTRLWLRISAELRRERGAWLELAEEVIVCMLVVLKVC